MSTQIEKAKEFAQQIHEGHFRRDGITPYFSHLETVVKNCEDLIGANKWGFNKNETEHIIIAAYLHDSVEDGKTNLGAIRDMFGDSVSLMVQILTHSKGEDYFRYVIGAAQYKDTRLIKIADVLANLADSPTQKQLVKYTEALKILIK